MAEIALISGASALVDDADVAHLISYRWRLDSHGYAVAYTGIGAERSVVKMHRVIMAAEKGQIVDHINGDNLDNRRENLRICSHAENMRNRKINKNHKVGAKGVRLVSKPNRPARYEAKIAFEKKFIYLGRFDTVDAASLAYQEASKKYHGEFSRIE